MRLASNNPKDNTFWLRQTVRVEAWRKDNAGVRSAHRGIKLGSVVFAKLPTFP